MFLLPILIGALAAADPAPANAAPAAAPAQAPPPASAQAPPVPGVVPPVAPNATPDAAPAASAPAASSDEEGPPGPATPPPAPSPAPGPAPAPGPPGGSGQAFPTPYTDLDAKAYSDAVLAASRAEEAMQGPLDGGWSVTDQAGKALYSLRMVDHGQGMTQAEGAWRDLAAPPGPAATGFVDSIGYDGGKVMLRFHETGPDDLVVLTLTPTAASAWAGELWRRGRIVKVIVSRDQA